MADIEFEIDERGIGLLTVNRPEVRNALNWAAMRAFAEAVEAAHSAPELRALIITGAGGHFVAGGDLAELQHYPRPEDGLRLAELMGEALAWLETIACPVLAAMNGATRGGGAEIAMACDMRVMAEDATLAFVQATLGLIPGWGGGQRLMRAVGYARALDLLATGRVLTATEAAQWHLANRLAPPGDALASAMSLAEQMAANPPEAVQAVKRILRFGLTHDEGLALVAERADFPPLWASEYRQQAMQRFLGGGSGE